MKKKGFTLVELLVVIGIIALLMGILMPALARVRQYAYRLLCGTSLSGIGKAMMIYAQDYDEEYPRAGGKNSFWSTAGFIAAWDADTQAVAFAGGRAGGANATIGSSFYLLAKYADVMPKVFVCKADAGSKEFRLSDYLDSDSTLRLEDVWDFEDKSGLHCSYSMHLPYSDPAGKSAQPVSSMSRPDAPVCATRNPYLDSNAKNYLYGSAGSGDPDEDPPIWDNVDGYVDRHKTGNAAPHNREGQNVLFNDGHVRFEKYPNCGIEYDNIYRCWCDDSTMTPATKVRQWESCSPGENNQSDSSNMGSGMPEGPEDAYLVNEHQ